MNNVFKGNLLLEFKTFEGLNFCCMDSRHFKGSHRNSYLKFSTSHVWSTANMLKKVRTDETRIELFGLHAKFYMC